MDRNNIRPAFPASSTTSSVESGTEVNSTQTGSAFSRTTATVNPDLSQQGLEPAATQATKIKDRVSADLTAGQKIKIGLLKLGAALLFGTRANHWLADKALSLLQNSYTHGQRTVAVKLQSMIDCQSIRLDQQQSETYYKICQKFASQDDVRQSEDPIIPATTDNKIESTSNLGKTFLSAPTPPPPATQEDDSDETAAPAFTFAGRINALCDKDKPLEALAQMEKEFFDRTSNKAIKDSIDEITNEDDMNHGELATIFNDIVYNVVTDYSISAIDEKRLKQLKIEVQSMSGLFPEACNYEKTTDEIDKKLQR